MVSPETKVSGRSSFPFYDDGIELQYFNSYIERIILV